MSNVKALKTYFRSFLALPWTNDSVPGSVVEEIVALTYGARVLKTYDYVDVVGTESDKRAWQVKSTMVDTPITWKRAKIANKQLLIENSLKSERGREELGNEILRFCNAHVQSSIEKYSLDEIIYARCIIFDDRTVKYFERTLATKENPVIFNPSEYEWRWSHPKKTERKEQLPALHGFRKSDGKKMWAWHGHGENQLHFSGESEWWSDKENIVGFTLPPQPKLRYGDFFDLITSFTKQRI